MRQAWALGFAISLGLAGCSTPWGGPDMLSGKSLDSAQRNALTQAFRELLATQQANQQVNTTSAALIADNSAGLLSNNGASLTRNAPILSNNAGGLLSNNGATYRLSATRDKAPLQHHVLADGNYFYRLGNPAAGESLVETFITRVPSTAATGFQVDDSAILVHARMTVTLGEFDPINGLHQPVTNHYAIAVLKSPVFQDYQSEVRITAPPLGKTQQYVSTARYTQGSLPVTAEATHSAFVTFMQGAQAVDLPMAGEERIRIGESLLQLSYQNVSGRGKGSGTWKRGDRDAIPLTYDFDFEKNLAQMRLSLGQEQTLRLAIRPGMQIEAGDAVDAQDKVLATLARRNDGAIVLRFNEGDETLLFE